MLILVLVGAFVEGEALVEKGVLGEVPGVLCVVDEGEVLVEKGMLGEEPDVLCVVDVWEVDALVVKSSSCHRIEIPKALIPPPIFNPIGITLVPLVIAVTELGRSVTTTVQTIVEYCGQLVEVWHE